MQVLVCTQCYFTEKKKGGGVRDSDHMSQLNLTF